MKEWNNNILSLVPSVFDKHANTLNLWPAYLHISDIWQVKFN